MPVDYDALAKAHGGTAAAAPTAAPVDEKAFRSWYANKAKQYDLNPDPDAQGQDYDYRAAYQAGADRDPVSKHWPSDYKKPGHEHLIVGGFNTKTGERVPGTPRLGESDLVKQGWDPETAKRLAALPEPKSVDYDALASKHGGKASTREPFDVNKQNAIMRANTPREGAGERTLLEDFAQSGPMGDVMTGLNKGHEGNYAGAAHGIVTGVGKVLAPAALPAVAAAGPAAALGSMVAGATGTAVGRGAAGLVTDNPDYIDVAGDVGGFIGGTRGALPTGRAISATSKATAKSAQELAGAAVEALDPDLVSIVSPRGGAILRKAQAVKAVLDKRAASGAREPALGLPPKDIGPVEPPLEFSRRLKRQQEAANAEAGIAPQRVSSLRPPVEPPAAPAAPTATPAPAPVNPTTGVVEPPPAPYETAIAQAKAATGSGPLPDAVIEAQAQPAAKLLDPDYAKSPQRTINELGIQARRLGFKLAPEQVDQGVALVRQGVRPDAVARAFAPAPVDPAAALAAKLGMPTPEMVAARVAERNRTGRWPGAPSGKQILARANAPD